MTPSFAEETASSALTRWISSGAPFFLFSSEHLIIVLRGNPGYTTRHALDFSTRPSSTTTSNYIH